MMMEADRSGPMFTQTTAVKAEVFIYFIYLLLAGLRIV